MASTSAPYTPAHRFGHGGYNVRALGYPVGAIRPNRNAAGMSFTNSRRGVMPTSPDKLRLSTRGTLDSLPSLMAFCILRRPGKPLGLNEQGKRRLDRLRRQRAARGAAPPPVFAAPPQCLRDLSAALLRTQVEALLPLVERAEATRDWTLANALRDAVSTMQHQIEMLS